MDDRPLEEFWAVRDGEPVEGLGDEALSSSTDSGGVQVNDITVARFGDTVVYLRNESIGNSDPAVQIDVETGREALAAFAEALPEDVVEQAATAVVDTDHCVPVDAEPLVELAGTIELARGGFADDAVRCTYRGVDGAKVQLSSSVTSNATDFLVSGDPFELPGRSDAEARIISYDGGKELTVVEGDRLSFVKVSNDDKVEVNEETFLALVDEFLGKVD